MNSLTGSPPISDPREYRPKAATPSAGVMINASLRCQAILAMLQAQDQKENPNRSRQ